MSRDTWISAIINAPFNKTSLETLLRAGERLGCTYLDYGHTADSISADTAIKWIENALSRNVQPKTELEDIAFVDAHYKEKYFSWVFVEDEKYLGICMSMQSSWRQNTDITSDPIDFRTAISLLLHVNEKLPILCLKTEDEYIHDTFHTTGDEPFFLFKATAAPALTGTYATQVILADKQTSTLTQKIVNTLSITYKEAQFYAQKTTYKGNLELPHVVTLLMLGEHIRIEIPHDSSYSLHMQPFLQNTCTLITLTTDACNEDVSLRHCIETALAITHHNGKLIDLAAHDTRYIIRQRIDAKEPS